MIGRSGIERQGALEGDLRLIHAAQVQKADGAVQVCGPAGVAERQLPVGPGQRVLEPIEAP